VAPKPLLFISHSSDDTDAAKAVAAALEPYVDVWLDAKALRAGNEWQLEIETALIDCHCAIVLLSPRVLARPFWVSTEAYFLSVRRRVLETSFTILPLTLPGFTDGDLDHASLAPAQLKTLQALAIDPATFDPTPLVQRLEPVTKAFASNLRYGRIEREVASKLSRLDGNARELLAGDVGLDFRAMRYVLDPARWLAAALLRTSFAALAQAHGKLAPLEPELAKDIFRAVAPYSWIDPEAAGTVARIATDAPPRQAIGMNATRPATPRLYVRRASSSVAGWLIFDAEDVFANDTSGAPAMDAALLDTIRLQLAEYLKVPHDTSDAELFDELEFLYGSAAPVFIVLPPSFASMDAALLERLRGVFPKLVFLVRSEKPDATLEQRFDDLVMLPALDPRHEERVFRVYQHCLPGETA
jgi:hypothetical protein